MNELFCNMYSEIQGHSKSVMDVLARKENRSVSQVREAEIVMDVSSKRENGNENMPCVAGAGNVMDVLAKGRNTTVPQLPEAETVWCSSNAEDNRFDVEFDLSGQIVNPGRSNDLDVNITEDINFDGNGIDEAKCNDETECSSSFADTYSEASSDAEVESRLFSYDPMVGMTFQMSKKNVSDQWKRFIRPLMSSCKWLELKIHEIKSINAKYGTEIAKHDERKQCEFGNFTNDGCSVKSVPFSSYTRKKIVRRTKRKRVEDATDVASYMSQHYVFSYFEKKRHVANGASSLDFSNLVNFGRKTVNSNNDLLLDDEFSHVELLNSFDSAEKVLRKIEVVKFHVRRLKSRIDKVVCENPVKFSSINMLTYLPPRNALTASCGNPESIGNGDGIIYGSMRASSHHISKCSNSGIILKPETAVSSDEEVASLPDMAVNIKQLQDGVLSSKIEDEISINNQTAKEELQHIGTFGNQLPNQAAREEKSVSVVQDDKLHSYTSVHHAITNEGNSSAEPEVHMAPKRKRRRRRHRWGF